MAEYEARISIYRNGRRIEISDARAATPTAALYNAHNDLELAMQRYEANRPREFDRDTFCGVECAEPAHQREEHSERA